MLIEVMYDLRIFILFYIIILAFFSLIWSVLGVGNIARPGLYRDKYKKTIDKGKEFIYSVPGKEYYDIGLIGGNLFSSMRISVGDFAI